MVYEAESSHARTNSNHDWNREHPVSLQFDGSVRVLKLFCWWLRLARAPQRADGNEEQEWDWITRGPGSGNKRAPLHSFHTVKRKIFETQATIDGWAYFFPWSCLFQWCHCWNGGRKENQQHRHLAVILRPAIWTSILASLRASHWKEGEGRQFRWFLNYDSRSWSVDYQSLLIRQRLKHINEIILLWSDTNKRLMCSLLVCIFPPDK